MMANVNINIKGIYEYINFLSSLQLLEHCHCTTTIDNTVPEKLQLFFSTISETTSASPGMQKMLL